MPEYLIPITIEYLDEGYYLATSPVLPGLIAQGETIAHTIEIAEDIARQMVELAKEEGTDPISQHLKSDSVVLSVRIPLIHA